MIQFDLSDDSITIKIPVSSIEELQAYQRSLLKLMSLVDLEEADAELVTAVEHTYKLLGLITPEQSTSDSLQNLRFLLGGE